MTQAQSEPASPGGAALPAAEPGSLHALVLKSLDDDQAQDLVSIPLEGKTAIADHMVIASGRSSRQVASMAEKLALRVKEAGFGHCRIEGLPERRPLPARLDTGGPEIGDDVEAGEPREPRAVGNRSKARLSGCEQIGKTTRDGFGEHGHS